jgi:hypothetical protein
MVVFEDSEGSGSRSDVESIKSLDGGGSGARTDEDSGGSMVLEVHLCVSGESSYLHSRWSE